MSFNKAFGISLLVTIVLVALLASAFFAYDAVSQPSEEEKQQDFVARSLSLKEDRMVELNEWHTANQPTEQEEMAKFRQRLGNIFLNGQHEDASFVERLTGFDLEKEVLASVRPVYVEIVIEQPLEQTLEDFGVEESSELPQHIVKVFADGTTHVLFDRVPNIGYLGVEHVRADSIYYEEICNNVPQDDADNVFVTFTLLADKDKEDAWKKEVLFEGTVHELCTQTEGYPKYSSFRNMVVFKRPAQKVLSVPSKDIALAESEDLIGGRPLYFPRLQTGQEFKLGTGTFEGITEIEGADANVIEFHGAFDPESDSGSPVYAVFAGTENPLRLVGFAGRYGTVALSADFTLADFFEEFPHHVVETSGE